MSRPDRYAQTTEASLSSSLSSELREASRRHSEV